MGDPAPGEGELGSRSSRTGKAGVGGRGVRREEKTGGERKRDTVSGISAKSPAQDPNPAAQHRFKTRTDISPHNTVPLD